MVLTGRRASGAVFMPGRRVFPGGRIEAADADLDPAMPARAAAMRETGEETGLALGLPGPDGGIVHAPHLYRPVFRAVTPLGHSRRFDALFLRVDAAAIQGDPDALGGDGELTDLRWQGVAEALSSDLPFPTRLALSQAVAPTEGVPVLADDAIAWEAG